MININEKNKVFSLDTKNTSYVFGIDNNGLVRSIYWGSKIENISDFEMEELQEVSTNDPVYEITKEEYPVYGGLRYKENCLKVTFDDGTRDLAYRYEGYEEEKNLLIIKLRDNHYKFRVRLFYKVYEEVDLIERWIEIENYGENKITIEEIYSGQMHIPYENLNFTNTHGHWGAEQQRFNQKVSYGKIVIENRKGISGHNHNPYFILDKNGSETSGEVFFGALRTSGNFRGVIEQTPYGETLVQMGLNPYDFSFDLKKNERFKTPSMLIGYSDSGFEKMTKNLHDFAKTNLLKEGVRPVLYNSWEATEFKVSCNEQIELAKKAKEIGAELFVVDDGWFGERDSINNGLGDWYVNKEKFPEGLNPLIDEVKNLDMKFGIWIEPEMVNPLSKLYKENPDWIYSFKNRDRTTSRGQYVLNVSKKEVKEFIFNMIDDLLERYDIHYIKWDANRPICEAGALNLEENERKLWYEHIKGVYDIVRELKKKHKDVLFEACASGGGRIDYGILGIFDDFWTSDNTDAYDRLFIQKSYSYIYPIKAMRAWVTDCPNFLSGREIPLKFRFHSAMMGTLGIGGDILKWSLNDLELAKIMIEEYKEIREIVQDGDFYRLQNESSNNYELFQYSSENEHLIFAFLPQSKIGHRPVKIKLRKLDKKALYKYKIGDKEKLKSGAYLMEYGIDLNLRGDYSSCIIHVSRR
ncbi:MAG: alpha-galactosidase [Clostridium sp.]